ncbi:hypothetical protein DFR79_10197 [Halanaerobium saccharolyticum]|uniref:Uncharacterized protein n=1 Tax=Halanaerobium saccharolyticum TaxID=43595 RepID=A0A4R6M1J4_9FIRM|nr:hypothetical protein [Halanaerobium saccharolyticum]TDO95098.1 hypothetical protein DFR79_10197 [Halanaerobium saccharolyticum]
MDKHDYHFISIKFLTAILMALVFAFLFVYVFTPQLREDYPIYSLQKSSLELSESPALFASSPQNMEVTMTAEKLRFKEKLKDRSFELMEQSKKTMLAVISANYLEKMNGLREKQMLALEAERRRLEAREKRLLQEKRQELEAELSQKLQQLRQEIRNKYSDFNQEQIRDNYLKMINLRLKIEFIARNESEREKYQQQLEKVKAEQQALIARKNSELNESISHRTSLLIMEFNQQYAAYREQLRTQQREILSQLRTKIENELAAARKEIKSDLAAAREQKAANMEQLIKKTKKEYY